MRFEPTKIVGCFVVHLDWRHDERGGFVRVFDAEAFVGNGLPGRFVQTNISTTYEVGTIRGLHWQKPPHEEVKLVRCLGGALFDVVVDQRANSATRGQWFGLTLREGDDRLIVVPAGCAHGFQTLSDRTSVLYHMSAPYAPSHADGVRFDDPAFAVAWPIPAAMVSERDRAWPLIQSGYDSIA